LIRVAGLFQRHSAPGPGIGIFLKLLRRNPEVLCGLLILAKHITALAAGEIGPDSTGPKRDGRGEVGIGFLMLAHGLVDQAPIVIGDRLIGFQLDGLTEIGNRQRGFVGIPVDLAAAQIGAVIGRRDADRSVVIGQRLFGLLHPGMDQRPVIVGLKEFRIEAVALSKSASAS